MIVMWLVVAVGQGALLWGAWAIGRGVESSPESSYPAAPVEVVGMPAQRCQHRPERVVTMQVAEVAVTDQQIELILEAHYRQVLASPAGRKVWKKLLSDVAAVERARKVGR